MSDEFKPCSVYVMVTDKNGVFTGEWKVLAVCVDVFDALDIAVMFHDRERGDDKPYTYAYTNKHGALKRVE